MTSKYIASGHFVIIRKLQYTDNKNKITDPSYKFEIDSIGPKAKEESNLKVGDIVSFEQGAIKPIDDNYYVIDIDAIFCKKG